MQRTKSKILSILLSLVMLLSLLPTTALAADTYPTAGEVSVDGSKAFSKTYCYFRNGEANTSTDSTNFNAHYDPDTGTLTLRDYKGGSITAGGNKESKITVVLVGDNFINDGNLNSPYGGDITVTSGSSGTLSITQTIDDSNSAAIGINAGYGNYKNGNVTITGNAQVKIDMTHTGTSGSDVAYGIFAKENITISGDASVDITCKTQSNTASLGSYCNGLYAAKDVTIETDGKIKINVTTAGDSGTQSFGIYPMGNSILTKVKEMEVWWKSHDTHPSYPGGAIRGGGSFDTSTHAVNEDTTNCYASYRNGEPYTVTVVNGDLTGLGVPNKMGSGMFLVNDTVNITPYERKSNSGEVIPFKEWTAEGMTLTSPTTADTSFNVPANAVTVTATHSPFVVAPMFKRTDDSKGTIAFQTAVKPDDGTEYFEYVKVGKENDPYEYRSIAPQPTTASTASPYEYRVSASSYYTGGDIKNLEAGEYRMAVTLNGERYLSDPFKVAYTESTANISVSGTIKSYGSASDAVTVTLTPTAGGTPLTAPLTEASGSAPYSQNYSFSAVPAGTYTLKVEKKGHAPWTENITVGTDDITGKDVTIYLIGDVNGDGTIDATDMQRIYAHISRENTFSNPAQGDVNGDGKVDATDMQRIYAHISRENPLS